MYIFQRIMLIVLFSFSHLPNSLAAESEKEYWCKQYAKNAVEQNEANIKYGCGFKTSRWSSNKLGQKKWCLTVDNNIYTKEHDIRESMLDQCFKNFATTVNKKNQIPLPSECIDLKSKYVPIYSFYNSHRYSDKIRTPVTNGLIKHDFNDDKKQDFLFIEENEKKDIKLTACISNINNNHAFMRKKTGISFSNGKGYLSGYSYYISVEQGLIVAVTHYTAHNEGSGSSSSFYKFDSKKKGFVFVKSSTNVEPVYYDYGNGLEPYPFSPPPPL